MMVPCIVRCEHPGSHPLNNCNNHHCDNHPSSAFPNASFSERVQIGRVPLEKRSLRIRGWFSKAWRDSVCMWRNVASNIPAHVSNECILTMSLLPGWYSHEEKNRRRGHLRITWFIANQTLLLDLGMGSLVMLLYGKCRLVSLLYSVE